MRTYTRAERGRRAWLVARGVKQAVAGSDAIDPRIPAEIDEIDDRAEDRAWRETKSMATQLDQAKNRVAAARTAERTAARGGKDAARKARRDAESALRRTEQAARRIGL
ncbi:hypothetical protein KQY30_18135 [Streptomyces sp. GMY02]|uniref:hypothetical protein n=1 Tax=Streptomyces sp. GMY02 TaxID=1333528 RepID=UPI001C2C0D3F|nr:hypothetical protein [Streptomyces sp. GMY02]QXE35895.1 hypothetical protein KQY30_18135 [Streptomyces sp. GMY02]